MRYLVILFIVVTACQHDPTKDQLVNKFNDPVMQEIYQAQDERNSAGILPFLKHQNPDYRREAALAFGSVQDTMAIEALAKLLNDQKAGVKIAAAYALGQIGNKLAEPFLIRALDMENIPIVRKELLESVGKCISPEGLEILETEQPQDSLEKEGLAWALYRAGISGVHSSRTIHKAVELLDRGNTYEARLGAAHFLYRSQGLDLNSSFGLIAESAKNDPAPTVRMASVRALGKITSPECGQLLSNILQNDNDYRVRINAILAMGNQDFEMVKEAVWAAVDDENFNTGIAAADFLLNQPNAKGDPALEKAKSTNNWRIRAILLAAALKQLADKDLMSDLIQSIYKNSRFPYEKAALMSALGQHPGNTAFIIEQLQNAKHKAVSTAAIQALSNIRGHQEFPILLESEIAKTLKECIASGDLALVGIAGSILRNPDYGYKEYFKDYNFLYEARETLSLPKDNEALQTLQGTIDYFEGTDTPKRVVNKYNHPIDWSMVRLIPPEQIAVIATTKGKIYIQLMINESPGSTINFIKLVNKGYYNGKNFHRVVPNFVIQGGCPRGDGWGGEDYSLRSELGMTRYREGYVGMASAGKDTEGVQWFITHSPTPHLDGKYSIFAKVIKGMEVVHQIQVGDQIKSIQLN